MADFEKLGVFYLGRRTRSSGIRTTRQIRRSMKEAKDEEAAETNLKHFSWNASI